jgi:hypothetical protein
MQQTQPPAAAETRAMARMRSAVDELVSSSPDLAGDASRLPLVELPPSPSAVFRLSDGIYFNPTLAENLSKGEAVSVIRSAIEIGRLKGNLRTRAAA